MASTTTTFSFMLKTRYTQKKVENLTLADRPFLARVTKDEDFVGDGTVIPLIHVNPQGIAGDALATAQANKTNIVGKKFTITNGKYSGAVDIGLEVMMASRNNIGAFMQNKPIEIDGLYEQMADNIAWYNFRQGGGKLGERASVSGSIVTLTNPTDIYAFEEGMVIVASADDGEDAADTLRAGSHTVTAVNRKEGKYTFSGTITSFTDGDSLFRQGDFFGNTGTVIVKGIQAYIWSDESPPALFNMTRTSDPTRLAGCRIAAADLTGKGIEERLELLGAYMSGRYKSKGPWDVYMHPENWQNLNTALKSRGQVTITDKDTRFGFKAIEACLGGYDCKIFSDPSCPPDLALFLNMKHWTLHSMGKLLFPVDQDGVTILRKSTTNDFEYRLQSFPQMSTNCPVRSGRVALA